MKTTEQILKEVQGVIDKIEETSLDEVAASLFDGKRIFVSGEGRSGFMAKSFAMRLMHLGATVFVVGETITPSMEKGDVLVAVSGSGKTQNVIWTAEKARSIPCRVVVITANPDSELASHASLVVEVPAATKYRTEHEPASIQPLGSLFDQSIHILFDAICLVYSKLKKTDHEQAFRRHSNLE
ncbi:6-phospho-3-hexuloisomerase [Paenibacillus phocaensis]|uniref:6-phospho-3-hexuloisomerase n=1 Tax=Paenibacillus phocaensis TaxID=1776378 RepID=UPI000839BC7D|nr:6-phospho-3-hexuloisomerase [Paenibacillus phocaensis]